jgi:hypothetical protein
MSDDSLTTDADVSSDDDNNSLSKRPRTAFSDRCAICFGDSAVDLVACPTNAGFETFVKAAIVLKDHVYMTLKPFLSTASKSPVPVVWHRACHRRYAHEAQRQTKKQEQRLSEFKSSAPATGQSDVFEVTSSLTTRATSSTWDKSLCIICQQRKHKGEIKVHMCQTLESSNKLKDAATFHNDRASIRILGCIDLVAGDGVYHNACQTSYIRDHVRLKRRGESVSSSACHSAEEDATKEARFYHEILSMVVGDNKVLDMNAITTLYNDITDNAASKAQVRELLEHNMSNVFEFSPPMRRNKAVLVYSKRIERGSLVQRIVDLLYDEAPEQQSPDADFVPQGMHEDHTIFYAAKIVRTAIFQRGKGIEIGDSISKAEVTQYAEQCLVPELTSLLRYLIDPVAGDEMSDQYSSDMFRRVTVSIAQDIVSATTSGRQKMPKHIVLACDLYYTFQSEMLIQILNRMGHCISYDSVKRHMAALADAQSRQDMCRSTTIPSNIEKYVPGRLIQHVMDNLDFREETLYGRTTHVTSQIVVQKAASCSRDLPLISTTHCRSRTVLEPRQIHINMDQRAVKLPKVLHVNSHVNQVSLEWYNPNEHLTDVAQQIDLAWAVCRHAQCIAGNEDLKQLPISGWKAFNVNISVMKENSTCKADAVGFLPLFDGSSQDTSVIRTLMIRAQERTTELCQPQCVVACDLGIYQIARKVKELEPDLFKETVVRIGVFHLHMKFIEVIGDRFGRAGLEELLSRSGLYGENTVKMILLGKAYNKAVRSAKLVYEVCFRLIFAEFAKEMENMEFVENLHKAAHVFISHYDSSDNRSEALKRLTEACKQLSVKLAAFICKKSLHSSTFMFWAELWKMLGILLRLIRADRECNFGLHLSAVAECLPYMFAFDKHNYARWLSVYVADMNSLQTSAPTVYEELVSGRALSVAGQQTAFNAVSLDMRLEQSLNKHAKGSLKGISTNPKARDMFILTAHHMADMHSAVAHMCGLSVDVHACKEAGKAQIYQDELDVRRLMLTFCGKMLNPFTTDGLELIQISNRRKASEAVQKASENAGKIGLDQMIGFVKERLNTDTKALSEPIRRNHIATFRTSERNIARSVKQVKSVKPYGTFSSLFQQKATVEKALKQELTREHPESLFRSDGTFIKKDKSILMKALENDIVDTSRTFPTVASCDVIVIYDGMALIHSLIKTIRRMKTFGDIAQMILMTVLRLPQEVGNMIADIHQLRVDIVMDRYDEYSTKDMEREQRTHRKGKAALSALPTIVTGPEQSCPADFDAFLEVSSNKHQLIKFISEQMLLNAPSVLQDEQELVIGGGFDGKTVKITKHVASDIPQLNADLEEADQRVMLHMKHAVDVGHRKYGLIVAADTDIAVCAIGSFYQLGTCEVYQLINSRLVPLHTIHHTLGLLKSAALVAFHALTGCDTTSHLSCRKSKKTLWTEVCKSTEVMEGMASFGQIAEPPRQIPEWLMKFVIAAYGCAPNCADITTARIKLFTALTKKKLDTDINRFLPPTDNALLPHIQRAALQTYISRQCCSRSPVIIPDVTKFGWKREGKMLLPVTVAESSYDVRENILDIAIENSSSSDDSSSDTGSEDAEEEEAWPHVSSDSDCNN